jgi:hypothetical protein
MDRSEIAIGQIVIVVDGYGRPTTTRGVISKIGRVWIDVTQPGDGWTRWHFRLDSQTDGPDRGSRPRFYTLDQWAERETQMAAAKYLREQGITIEHRSAVWHGREVDLAKLLGWSPPAADGAD